jgi:hypothetical protein
VYDRIQQEFKGKDKKQFKRFYKEICLDQCDLSKVLKNGPLPRKRPRQKGKGSGRYRFLPFLHSEQKSQ